MSISAIVLIAIVVILVAIIVSAYYAEAKRWNGGICVKTGKPWMAFDMASDGSVGYSDGESNYLWISWSTITKDKRNVK